MKTSVMEVRDMLSVLSALGVEKRIGEVPGVESVTVNYAAGTATVRYDETRLNVADIKSDVRQSGFEEVATTTAAGPAGGGHKGHTTPDAAPASPASPTPKSSPGTPAAAGAGSAGAGQPDKAAPDGAPPSTSKPSPGADAPAPATPGPAGDEKKGKAP